MSTDTHENENQSIPKKRVIRLDDLDWQDEVVGGSSGKLLFGEDAVPQKSPFDDLFKPGNGRGGASSTP